MDKTSYLDFGPIAGKFKWERRYSQSVMPLPCPGSAMGRR